MIAYNISSTEKFIYGRYINRKKKNKTKIKIKIKIKTKNPAVPVTELYSYFIINTEFILTILWVIPTTQYSMYVNPFEYTSTILNYVKLYSFLFNYY